MSSSSVVRVSSRGSRSGPGGGPVWPCRPPAAPSSSRIQPATRSSSARCRSSPAASPESRSRLERVAARAVHMMGDDESGPGVLHPFDRMGGVARDIPDSSTRCRARAHRPVRLDAQHARDHRAPAARAEPHTAPDRSRRRNGPQRQPRLARDRRPLRSVGPPERQNAHRTPADEHRADGRRRRPHHPDPTRSCSGSSRPRSTIASRPTSWRPSRPSSRAC